ncbi:unnamed protein product [Chondrus crispus]|uniref:Uncharacterized protein n=1 Tax=Chondrus crispus TaxID=2769 RepID=R7Q5Z9_CHOCR|nr:unnamed protein product [Chondrus crispus]CDF32890.1 unnamed protein product [Chondrus crispus]|eukprot:XP_005712691.1 unnamed protein product [Chondrus crispus]
MSSVYSDVASMTRHVDSTVAMLVEQKIIAAIAGPVDCDPTPKLACSLQQGNVHINTTAINIARRPKRRRVHRPPGGPALPSLSTPALLLIGAAEKHQTSLLNALMGASVAEDSSSHSTAVTMNTASLSAAINSGKVSGDGSVNSDVRTATGKNGAATMSKPAAVQKRRLLKPPKSLLQLHREKNETNVRSLANRSGQPNIPPRQEHLRVVRLVLPDQNGKVTLQRLSNAEATMPRENAERIQIAKQQALTAIAKNGGQMYVLEFIKYPSRGFEIMISRFVYGDRNRDAFRVRVGSEEEGHQFLNQFKVLAGKEGFHVMQDLKWSQHLRQKQQQHQQQQQQQQQHARALQQRQNAITAGRQPAVSQTQSNAQNAALQSKRAQARALSQSNPPANARQILLQKQKQPDVREQHRLQRERQKAAQSGHQNLAALRQGATHTHMPLQGQPMGAQSQLSQQHQRSHMALQQQQQQLFQQHVQLQRQEPQRARRRQTQLPGRDNMNISMAQPVALSASNARGGLVSQGPGAIQGNLGLPQAGGPSSSIAGMGSAGLMGHQVLTQSQMRQFQQNLRNQNLRNQQPLLAEHQRNLMAAAGGRDAVTGMAGNTGIAANAAMAQHLPTHVLANFMSAGMASGAARPGAAPNLTAAETLTRQRQRMQQQQHLKQQRENVEPHARSAKR